MRADRVLQLRELLDKLSSTAGLVNEEKGLLVQTFTAYLMKKQDWWQSNNAKGGYFWQLFFCNFCKILNLQVQCEVFFLVTSIEQLLFPNVSIRSCSYLREILLRGLCCVHALPFTCMYHFISCLIWLFHIVTYLFVLLDPEEFLNSLLQQVLKADPFLHLKWDLLL